MAHPSREATSRNATARPAIGGGGHGRLHIDPALLDPKFDYQWIRETTLGEYDEGNVQAAMEQNGFVPVDTSSLPGAAPPKLPGRKAADSLIRRGGLILMMRAKEIAEDQRNDHQRANEEAIAGVTKDLAQRMDGRNFQGLSDKPVQVAVERGGPDGAVKFAE